MLTTSEANELHAGLAVFSHEVRELTTAKGWREDDIIGSAHAFAAYIGLAHSELSEALDASRDRIWHGTCEGGSSELRSDHMAGCSGKPHLHPKPVGVGAELADAMIRIIDMADRWGVNLPGEIVRVMEYGWTREYQHGGRTL